MQPSEYTSTRNSFINYYKNSFTIKDNENLYGQFNMVSAGLVNYLPAIDVDQHENIYKDILLHKKLSILEQSTYTALDYVTTENLSSETFSLLKNKPAIICTFHMGSYRILNLFLTKNKIPYSLVMGNDIVKQEGEIFQSLYKELPETSGDDGFKIINAEASNVGLQMLRELKRGRSLLLYIDGNTGAGAATTKNDNRCVVNFLHQQLFARKGIAYLAHTARVPIVTVASYRSSWENIRLKFFDPIFPDIDKEKNLFAEETTQQIYNQVAPLIAAYPEQWEGWLYIHKAANIIHTNTVNEKSTIKKTNEEKVSLDSFQFGIFKVNGSPFLLRKNTYSFYEINNQLYDLLSVCNDHPVKRDYIDEGLFTKLYEQGVITYV
jgi:lauroyl/myristoyl acyltransferase